MNVLLRPAVALANRLLYPTKFALIFLIFCVPIGLSTGLLLKEVNTKIDTAEGELLGLEYLTALRPALDAAQRHRGAMGAVLAGDAALLERARAARAELEGALARLAAVDAQLGERLKMTSAQRHLAATWQQLRGAAEGLSPAESWQRHTALIDQILTLNAQVAKASGIDLDPWAHSFYLTNAVAHVLPSLAEHMGQARGLATAAAAAGSLTEAQRRDLTALSVRIADTAERLRGMIRDALEAAPSLRASLGPEYERLLQDVGAFAALLEKRILGAAVIDMPASEVFAQASKGVDGAHARFDATLGIARQVLEDERAFLQHNRMVVVTAILVTLVLAAYLFAGFYRAMRDALYAARASLLAQASGDLRQRAASEARDEVGEMIGALNQAGEKTADLVRQLVASVEQLASASEEVSVVSEQASRTLHAQQAETEQLASAMNEMTASVQEVARSSAQGADAAQGADRAASRGREVVLGAIRGIHALADQVEQTAQAIGALREDAQRIGAVVDVIRGITEQTNLLALNAAIEAARAGEQGRGFAVVADEVRSLANRTNQSTHEIQDMIAKLQGRAEAVAEAMEAGQRMARGSIEQASEGAKALEDITSSVKGIVDVSLQIAAATEQQSQVAEEINRNVVNISTATRETVTGSQQTAAASRQLAELAAHQSALAKAFTV